MRDRKVKVLYIAGWGRSGSTLLGNVLGQLDGFAHVGEMRHIWDDMRRPHALCGCGLRLRDCDLWTAVFGEAFGGLDQVDYDEMCRVRDSSTRIRDFPRAYIRPRASLRDSAFKVFLSNSDTLYRAVRDVARKTVIVDSSKLPSYAAAVGMLPTIDLYVVHLVRDPRAIAYSWQRKKLQPEWGTYFRQITPMKTSLLWDTWSVVAELLGTRAPERYLRLRYEDFIGHPQEAVARILDLVEEASRPLPLTSERAVELGINHTVAGNPNRFQTGAVELRLDDEWKASMRASHKGLVTALTWPWLLRYRYPVRP